MNAPFSLGPENLNNDKEQQMNTSNYIISIFAKNKNVFYIIKLNSMWKK